MIQRRPWHGVEWSLFIVLTGAALLGLLYSCLHIYEQPFYPHPVNDIGHSPLLRGSFFILATSIY